MNRGKQFINDGVVLYELERPIGTMNFSRNRVATRGFG